MPTRAGLAATIVAFAMILSPAIAAADADSPAPASPLTYVGWVLEDVITGVEHIAEAVGQQIGGLAAMLTNGSASSANDNASLAASVDEPLASQATQPVSTPIAAVVGTPTNTAPALAQASAEPLASSGSLSGNVLYGGVLANIASLLQSMNSYLAAKGATQATPQQVAANGNPEAAGAGIAVDQLSNTTISNPTITGGSISGTSIIGTISNAIDTAIATIDDLTATNLVAINATTTNATSTNEYVSNLTALAASTTNATTTTLYATSATIPSLSVTAATATDLAVTGTTTLAGINLSTINCSTFGNGGKLTTDAFGDVICAPDQSGGAGSTVAGSNGQVQFNSGGSFAASSAFTYATTTNTLAVTNASTTNLSASGNSTLGNATSTDLFSSLADFTTTVAGTLSASVANITGLTATNATTTNLVATNATTTTLYAASAAIPSLAGTSATFSGATTSALAISNVASSLLKTTSAGSIIPAVAGTDYQAPIAAGNLTVGSNLAVSGGTGAIIGSGASISLGSNVVTGTTNDTNVTGSVSANNLTLGWTGTLAAGRGGTGIGSPAAAGILLGNYTGTGWQQLATSSLGLLTTNVAEGSNLYFTPARVASVIAGTTTDALAQGTTNRYFSNALAQGAISVSGAPLTYSSGTIGINQANASQAGYLSAGDWNTFNGKLASTSLSAGAGIGFNSATGVITNSGVTNLAASYPLLTTSGTGSLTLSLGFGTTTANAWSQLQTFANGYIDTASSTHTAQTNFTTASSTAFSATTAFLTVASTTNLSVGTGAGFLQASGNGAVSATSTFSASSIFGILGVGTGGTGIANPSAAGILLGNYTGTGWQQLATSSLGLLTTNVAEGSNLYFTPARVASVIAGTTTDALAQGATNKYFSNALAQSAISVSGAPLTYSSGVIGLNQANASQPGYLSAGDWSGFNNKIASTSLSAGTPLTYNSATGAFGFDFTHANSWTGLQQFTNSSSSVASVFGTLYVGGISTTTISNTAVNLPSGGTYEINGTNILNCTPVAGATGDGTTDNTAALNAALASLSGEGGCLSFPAGKFKFNSAIAYSFPSSIFSITIVGAGSDSTTLYWPSGQGMTFNYTSEQNSFHIRDLSLTTGMTNGTGTALTLYDTNPEPYQAAQNDIDRVTFRGDDGAELSDYWNVDAQVVTVNDINFNDDTFFGNAPGTAGDGVVLSGYNVTAATNASTPASGAGSTTLHFSSTPSGLVAGMNVWDLTTETMLSGNISSTSGTTVTLTAAAGSTVGSGDTVIFVSPAVVYNLSGIEFANVAYGLVIDTGVQGVTVSQSNIGGIDGILAPANQVGLLQLSVINSQFNTLQSPITSLSPLGAVNIAHNLFFVGAGQVGVNLSDVGGFVVEGNTFNGYNTGTAIQIGVTNGWAGTISSNVMTNFTNGVVLTGASSHVQVLPQQYLDVTTPISDSGTNNTSSSLFLSPSGNVGIGTTNPFSRLTVAGSGNPNPNSTSNNIDYVGENVTFSDGSFNHGGIRMVQPGTNDTGYNYINSSSMVFQTNSVGTLTDQMIIKYNGNVGIGTTSPATTLDVGGNITDENQTNCSGVRTTATGELLCTSSDERVKQDVEPLDASSSLAAIDALKPVSFLYKDPLQGTGTQLGFLAQQVQQIFPGLVATSSETTPWSPDGTLTLNYDGLVAPIIEAVQQIYEQLTALEQTVAGFAERFVSNTLVVNNELCVGTTCVTPAQFQAMVAASTGSGQAAVIHSASASPSPSSSTTSTLDSTSSPQVPIIQINGDNPAIVQVDASYSDLGATITGPQADLNLGIATFVNGAPMNPVQIDTTAAATDTIDYVVTDQSGLTATSTRTVIIQAANDNQASSTPANDNTPATTTVATSTTQ